MSEIDETNENILVGSAPTVFVPKENVARAFDEAIEQWKKEYPWEVTAFLHQMKLQRARHPDGKSYGPSMTFYFIGEVPRTLYTLVSNRLGTKHWLRDKEVMRLWWERFQAGRINPRDPLPKDPTHGQRIGSG